jgi:hypothetical protein
MTHYKSAFARTLGDAMFHMRAYSSSFITAAYRTGTSHDFCQAAQTTT